MPYKTIRRALTAAACVMALSIGSGAKAGTVNFTWDPSATPDSTVGPFTADTFSLEDFATINVPANPTSAGSVKENGFLLPLAFINASGTTVANANQVGTFGMYEQFTTTSHLIPCSSGECGSFDSVSATLYIYSTAHGIASVSFASSSSNPTIHLPTGADPIELATITGILGGSPNNANISSGVPNAAVDSSFTISTAYPAFFVSPDPKFLTDLEQAFTNTTGVITSYDPVTMKPGKCSTTACIFQIHAGGGNANFIPEPGSLAVLGLGLASLGFIRRRKVV
jgi:PEP-CTERM motif